MAGFTKLFNTIITSTIWCEDNETRIMWITFLALADANGFVAGSPPGLAHAARVSLEAARKAIEILESPDPDSRTKDNEGRRVIPCDGGWLLTNFKKYRHKTDEEARREYFRIKQRECRARKMSLTVKDVNNSQTLSRKITQAEAEADINRLLPGAAARPALKKNRKDENQESEKWSKVANALRRIHAFHPSNPTINEEGVRRFVGAAKKCVEKANKKPSDLLFCRMIAICIFTSKKLDVTSPVDYAIGAFKKNRFYIEESIMKKATTEYNWIPGPADNRSIGDVLAERSKSKKEEISEKK